MCTQIISQTKIQYFSSKLDNANNKSHMAWKILKQVTNSEPNHGNFSKKKNYVIVENPQTIAENFN